MLSVAFAPMGSPGTLSGTLVVSGTSGSQAEASLVGRLLTPPLITLAPGQQAYGEVALGQSSGEALFTMVNMGESPSGPATVSVSGSGFVLSSNGCGAQLPGGGACSVTVRFQPQAVGPAAGVLTAQANPGGSATASLSGTGTAMLTVQLMGNGLGAVSSSPAGIDCGGACSSVFASTQVTRTATPGLRSAFSAWGGSCGGSATSCGASLVSPSQTVTATFVLVPAALSIAPAAQSFGDVLNGNSSTPLDFLVTNEGGETTGAIGASVSDPGSWAVTGGSCSGAALHGGGSCTVSVTFSPLGALGAKSATLTVTAAPGGQASASLSGTETCAQYGAACASGLNCCDSVPCISLRCRYP
jgi:hypothetical protein